MLWGEQVADVAERFPKGVIGTRLGLSQMGLEFCEGHFDGIEIGGVFRQEKELGAARGQGLCGARAFVDFEVVQDHDVAR